MADSFGARRSHKSWLAFQSFIKSVKEGKKCIIYSPDYVVISKNVYDEMIHKLNPLCDFPTSYDEDANNDWLRKRFLSEIKPNVR